MAIRRRYKVDSANTLAAERRSEMTVPPDDFALRAPAGLRDGQYGFPVHAGARVSPDEFPGS